MSQKTSLSLNLKRKHNVLNDNNEVASVFNQDSDSDSETPVSAEDKFRQKYGNKKEKDERAVKKIMEEDESVYDYDKHYDEMERRKEEVKTILKQNDKEGKPKYADKLQKAKQRRDLEKLIIEEKKQERERAEEGDEFEDKEVFVTGEYRKQIEEKEKFRKELEAEEHVNDINDVTKASMYRETFAKKLLDDRVREREMLIKEEPTEAEKRPIQGDETPKKDDKGDRDNHRKGSRERHDEKRRSTERTKEKERRDVHKEDRDHKHGRDSKDDKDRKNGRDSHKDDKGHKDDRDSHKEEHKSHKGHRERQLHDEQPRKEHKDDNKEEKDDEHDTDSRKKEREHKEDRDSHKEEQKSHRGHRERLLHDQQRRMDKVRKVLARRNNQDQIDAYVKRCLQRRAEGLVKPPIVGQDVDIKY
ncbi:unnamed protein product [Bursaphelenchus okinawaensis]|uniref:Nuclear speckle splicing regulatory protein 1 N-terminal domain-containing protein n=1 Tax=Bursaphelenchus okinawaensis TaxID=465554 RepID=A0A811LGP1_9BILA|nr:unnamed protein product [Bursaphelenchus okinawaensis]CAG9122055.1 unnamed protein product [Bursaphelenchus okinawaensis]